MFDFFKSIMIPVLIFLQKNHLFNMTGNELSPGVVFCWGNQKFQFPITERDALAFEFFDILSTKPPKIEFGLMWNNEVINAFDYITLLNSLRSNQYPLIPFDCIGVPIRLFYETAGEHTIRYSLYISNELILKTASIEGADNVFLDIQADAFIVSFGNEINPPIFHPTLLPQFWSSIPIRILIRGFDIHSNTLRSAYSEKQLELLPTKNKFNQSIVYFEVIIRSSAAASSGITIGIVNEPTAPSDCAPCMKPLTIGFSCETKSITVSGEHFDVNNIGPLTSGHIVGLGLFGYSEIILTYDGTKVSTLELPNVSFQKAIPVVSTSNPTDEAVVNLGQLPFAYKKIQPPNHWPLFIPKCLDDNFYSKGPPPEYHILHFFPYSSINNSRIIECYVAANPLKPPCRYEVTILQLSGDQTIGIGFSGGDFIYGNFVGWDPKTIGVHSDDGSLFYESGTSHETIIDPCWIHKGVTIGFALDDGEVYYTVGKDKYHVASNFTNPTYPTITVSGSIVFIVNYGDSPFVFTSENEDSKGVKLFNGVHVNMTNKNLEMYGLNLFDEIEARDLSLRGRFVGELNGIIYVQVNGIDGAVPLNVEDSFSFRQVFRVTKRYSEKPAFRFVLTYKDCAIVNIASMEQPEFYATNYGISMLLGTTIDNKYVMRPIIDLMNNAPCFIVDKLPPNIMNTPLGQIESHFNNLMIDLHVLDVIEDPDHCLMLMLGTIDGDVYGWNNQKIVQLKTGFSSIVFRFFGFCFKNSRQSPTINAGTKRGGQYFPPNFQGTTGSVFYQHSTTQRSYGSAGILQIPPAVAILLTSLNEQYSWEDEKIIQLDIEATKKLEWVHPIPQTIHQEIPTLPLVKKSYFKNT